MPWIPLLWAAGVGMGVGAVSWNQIDDRLIDPITQGDFIKTAAFVTLAVSVAVLASRKGVI